MRAMPHSSQNYACGDQQGDDEQPVASESPSLLVYAIDGSIVH